MPLSHITGITSIPKLPYWSWLTDYPLLDPKNVVLIAIRDIDNDEYLSLNKHGIKCFTMDHVDKYGIGDVMRQTIQHLDPDNKYPFHISFDVDGIDPEVVSQTGTLFRYGLSARESVHIVRRLVHERKVVSLDVVEINEDFEKDEEKRKNYRGETELKTITKTVGMGVDLISSVFCRQLELS
jgi:arginase